MNLLPSQKPGKPNFSARKFSHLQVKAALFPDQNDLDAAVAGLALGAVVGTAAVVSAAYWYLYGSHFVSTDNAYAAVEIAQVTPSVGGTISEVRVTDTQSVKKGDVLVVLSNTSLTLEILNSEAELAEKQNILRNTLISMEQEKLSLRQDKAQLDLDVSRKKRAERIDSAAASFILQGALDRLSSLARAVGDD